MQPTREAREGPAGGALADHGSPAGQVEGRACQTPRPPREDKGPPQGPPRTGGEQEPKKQFLGVPVPGTHEEAQQRLQGRLYLMVLFVPCY